MAPHWTPLTSRSSSEPDRSFGLDRNRCRVGHRDHEDVGESMHQSTVTFEHVRMAPSGDVTESSPGTSDEIGPDRRTTALRTMITNTSMVRACAHDRAEHTWCWLGVQFVRRERAAWTHVV